MSSLYQNTSTSGGQDARLQQLTEWLATTGLVEVGTGRPASADASFRRYFRYDVVPEMREKLAKKLTLTFAKDNLERSIQMVSDETGVPMEILGGDLQLEGITKNQSFGLDEKDKTADEILRVILAKSNPDGKLVYIVKEQAGEEWVFITTLAAVAKRGDKLPPAFAPTK